MVASKMLFLQRPGTINSTGICLDRAGIAWDRRGGEADAGDGSDAGRPDDGLLGPCAGAALYRRAMLDDIGLFDEAFFCYLEDVDLAWRAQLAGWRCAYAPAARVYHAHSGTAGENSPFKRYLLGRNKVWLIAKNYPSLELALYLPLVMVYDLLGLATYVLFAPGTGSSGSRLASIRGRLAGLAGLPQALRQRREVQRRRRPGPAPALAPLQRPPLPWNVYRRYAHLLTPEAPGPGDGPAGRTG